MGFLAGKLYDPAAAGSVATTTGTGLAMTAMDTTNLRLTFTVPANGSVLVKMRGTIQGATTFPQVLLGILEGATVKARVVPIGGLKATALATSQMTVEALFVVSGLTAGASLTWDAAYGVETGIAATAIRWGGPNNTTTNDAFGGFAFEIYDCPNLAGAVLYDPGAAVSKATSSLLAMTAFDTTNARITFTAQTSQVLWRIKTNYSGATTFPQVLLGVLDGATVKARQSPIGDIPGTAVATTNVSIEASGLITGLTRGTSYSYDAAYGVEIVLAATNIHYGGPNDTTANNAWGALAYEIWWV